MKVYLDTDNRYPVVSLFTVQNSSFDVEVEVPSDIVKEYEDVTYKYAELQRKLLAYYKAAKEKG